MIRFDCRHYVGTKPCSFKRACEGCPHHDTFEGRILLIKLGALGDLLRTTSLLPSLRKSYPRAQITVVTLPECRTFLEHLSEVDRIWETDASLAARLLTETFDLAICLDKEAPAVQAIQLARAKVKRGFGINEHGQIIALNPASEYSLRMGIDDELKFRVNQKTYQTLIHEMAEIPPAVTPPPYLVRFTADDLDFGKRWRERAAPGARFLLGINPGAGRVFATKKWHPYRYLQVIEKLAALDVTPVLLGGPDERELLDWLERGLKKKGLGAVRAGEQLSLRQFASIVGRCDGMLTGDTLAMHLALAQKVKTLVLFTSTCAQEIELFGHGARIVGSAPCAPCYRSQCNQTTQICADSIGVDDVVRALTVQMGLTRARAPRKGKKTG